MTWPGWLLLGATLGAFQTYSQMRTVVSLKADAPLAGVTHVFVGAALRLLLAVFLLIWALREGLLPGLLAFTGLILARWLLLIAQNRS